jgi:hypothetical protein
MLEPAMSPTLSIVIPAYNIQRYIEQCVRSVLGQLRDHHEVIVLDDGSTDNTRALVSKLQQDWPGSNFHVITQSNEGLAGARNHGVRIAKGEYIVWVDGDDVLLDGVLAMLDQAIAEYRPDVVACDFRMWHPQEPSKTHYVRLDYPDNELLRDPEVILNSYLAGRKTYVWTNVIRRELYAQLPDPIFPPGRVFEDVSTVPRLLSQCASLLHLPKAIIDYRQHPASITQSVSEKWCMDFAAALPVARRHLQARGVSDSVRRHFDIAAGHVYIGVVKSTYQLPGAVGKRVRSSIKASFIENLFGDCAQMLETTRDPATRSTSRNSDLLMIRQVRSALSGNLVFHFSQAASRKLKTWRQARKLRKYRAAITLAEGP